MTKPLWEEAYADIDAKSFGEASQEVLDLIPMLAPGSKVLDLGCGDGRNAIPLARAGFDVIAMDISEAGILKLKTLADREELSIRATVSDMTTHKFVDEYDLIISHGCLHFVKPEQWEKLIREFKAHTRPNGFNVITVFTNEIPIPADLADLCVGLFCDGELYDRYSGWNVILKKSYTFQDEHAGGIRHIHSANKLVAEKIPAGSL